MPWCPNCKTEYREGITHCADCKMELVADLNEVKVRNATAMIVKVESEQLPFAQKLVSYLNYSGVSAVLVDEGTMVGVYTTPEEFKNARRYFKAFYSVESEMILQRAAEAAFLSGEEYEEDTEEGEANEELTSKEQTVSDSSDEKHFSKKASAQKMASCTSAVSRYEDYRSSGYTFTVLGVLGIAFALLNFLEIMPFVASSFVILIMFLMFAVFLVLGIFSFQKANTLKGAAATEKHLVTEAKAWLNASITEATLREIDGVDTANDQSAELLYLNRLDKLQNALLSQFPDLQASLAEQLIEEFYTQNFE